MNKPCAVPSLSKWAGIIFLTFTLFTPAMVLADSPASRATVNTETRDDDFDFIEEETKAPPIPIRDPLSPWNRMMFKFNDKLYFWVLKPVARGYGAVLPHMVRTGIKNFFYNLKAPIRVTSCVLQGKGEKAMAEISRFVVNSTAGGLCFADVAKKYPRLNTSPEDLGQTFGRYGIGNGIYLVWPFLGPSTLRDTLGFAGDQLLNPVPYFVSAEENLEITALETINQTSLTIGNYESLKNAAIQPYEAFRNAYIQYRQNLVSE
jgi:phospholipid-binding lipoprotein MlaA